ncbi:hypothetical protein [Candidatus Uabimicrobium amorphum]|uniref:Uncharacterized protein n=1 Tax=Uabimicrobium amorphum TaxID=2596890 RepID=A0A5S9F653_UABAM|nr:hypothetical protein [Candidatus Uabimicrobium amorphum]BBM86823.1 hypothetical protein UABAM_05211 [Candidatus Uabimicrobium amorphum]
MYGPAIESSEVLESFTTDIFEARLLGNIQSLGTIKYLYVLSVYRPGETAPCTFITAEVNAMAEAFGGGSHFLCAFADGSHMNFGSSDEWADTENFKAEALSMAKEYVKKGSF